MTNHCIMLARAQALVGGDAAIVILCDLAVGRAPDDRDLRRVAPATAARLVALTRSDARAELERS